MAARIALLVISAWLAATPVWSQTAVAAALHCRVAKGPWQRCRMSVNADGLGWHLDIGGEQIRFRHDGRGAISMERRGSAWQSVEARWLADASLCWDGICAKGDIPLD